MSRRKEKLVRTTITLPRSLKEKMEQTGENWSEVIRDLVSERLVDEGWTDMAEAVVLNERVRRPAHEGWDSLRAIKQWRKRNS